MDGFRTESNQVVSHIPSKYSEEMKSKSVVVSYNYARPSNLHVRNICTSDVGASWDSDVE